MNIELSQEQVELLLSELDERHWALVEEAAGKFAPRPGSPRHRAELQAASVRVLMWEIEEQQQQE
jgi:hypothetical protein